MLRFVCSVYKVSLTNRAQKGTIKEKGNLKVKETM